MSQEGWGVRRSDGPSGRGRSREMWKIARWLTLGALAIATCVLGYLGFAKHYATTGEPISVSSLAYLTLGLFAQKFADKWPIVPWQLDVARFAAPLIAAWAAAAGLSVLFRKQLFRLRLRFMKRHTVVCGAGRTGVLIASRMAERGENVVVLDPDEAAPLLERAREAGCITVTGDATDPLVLRKSRVHRARSLVACCDNDGTNAQVIMATREVLEGRTGTPLVCSAHVTDSRLWDLLRERELAGTASDPMRTEFFNLFEAGARVLLDEDLPITTAPPETPPHVVVIGLGQFGSSVVADAARVWWNRHGEHARPLRMTVIDLSAAEKVDALRNRYPGLDASCDIEARDLNVRSAEFERGEFLGMGGRHPANTVYVCFDDDGRSLTTALWVRDRTREGDVRVVARMTGEAGLAQLITACGEPGTDGVSAFPLLERVCTTELVEGGTRERLARAFHATYAEGRRAAGDTPSSNPSIVPWEQLPSGLKESNRRQADDVGCKLAAIGAYVAPLRDWTKPPLAFSPEEVELLARMEHERWCEERSSSGWRYAPGPRNEASKTSPHLVPWQKLDEPVREIDRSHVRTLPKSLHGAGFRIVRAGCAEAQG